MPPSPNPLLHSALPILFFNDRYFVFQTLAVVFVLIGVGTVVHIRDMQIAVGMKDQHFTSAHSWVGLIATILLTCHWIVGMVAFQAEAPLSV